MPNLENALQELREDAVERKWNVRELNQIISGIESLNGAGSENPKPPTDPNDVSGDSGSSRQALHVGCRTPENQPRAKSALGKAEWSSAKGNARDASGRPNNDRGGYPCTLGGVPSQRRRRLKKKSLLRVNMQQAFI